MKPTKHSDISDKLLIDTRELQALLSAGYSTTVNIGKAAGARVQVGKRVLWNVSKVQEYLNSL